MTSTRSRRALLPLLAVCFACQPGVEHLPVIVRLGLDETSCQGPVGAESIPLTCGGNVGARVLRAGAVADERCGPFDPDPQKSLRDLPGMLANSELEVTLSEGESTAVEVFVQTPRALGPSPCTFAGEGSGVLDVHPVFEGTSGFVLPTIDTRFIEVELRCGRARPTCGDTFAASVSTFDLSLEDLESGAALDAAAAEAFEVRIGYAGLLDGTSNFGSLGQLERNQGSRFSGAATDLISFPHGCALALVTPKGGDLSQSIGTCLDLFSPESARAYALSDAAFATRILSATAQPTIPPQGILIGRATTSLGAPVAGIELTLSSESPPTSALYVEYPSADFTGLGTATASHGYFVIHSINSVEGGCCQSLGAHRGGNWVGVSAPTGLITGTLMVVHVIIN